MSFDDLFAEIHAEHPEVMEIAHEIDPPHYLALNVMRLRLERGMTQEQLAAAIGVSQPRIAVIEGAGSNPRLLTLSKLAHALGVTLSELLEDTLHSPEKSVAARSAVPRAERPRRRKAG